MRKIVAMFALTLLSLGSARAERVVQPFNSDWTFRFAHGFNDKPRRVELPHTWNAADALSGRADYFRGMGVYEKPIVYDPSWAGKRVYLRFEGSNEVTTVFVNSRFAGEHKGGYGAFVFDITDLLNPEGKNSLTVKVTNALNLDIMPLVGDFNMYGGIYRDLNIIAVDPLHISLTDYGSPGVYLTQQEVSRERARVEASVLVENQGAGESAGTVSVRIKDGDRTIAEKSAGFSAAPSEVSTVRLPIEIEKPHLWNGRKDPFIYTADITITDSDGNVTDRLTQPLGLRYYSVDPDNGFSLNGERVQLHGVCRHQDRAERGNALLPMHHAEDVAIMEEMGVNAVRLAHYPQATQFYDLMDKSGMVVWAEIPFIGPGGYPDRGFNDLPAFRENGKEQLRELIRQHYNHPSICFWGMFNELKTHGDNPIGYVTELDSIAHAEDPTRLTTAASFLSNEAPINGVTDLIAWNQYFGWYGGKPSHMGVWLDKVHKDFPKYRVGVSEYGAGASIYHQQDSVKPGISSGYWHPENYQTYYHMENWKAIDQRPFVWGSFVWNMFDFGAAHRTEGDRNGINDKGLVTFDRKNKKDAFYFYKANWNKQDPFVYIANRRHDRRTLDRTDITIFTNQPEVELTVNGKNIGKMKADGYGTVVFEKVDLIPGENTVTARAPKSKSVKTDITDSVTWTLIK